MTYNLKKTDGTALVSVPDNTLDTTATSLTLIGRNALNFGQPIDQNFIGLLQNWANNTAPYKPLQGQIWYDTANDVLKVYTGTYWREIVSAFDGTTGTVSVPVSIYNTPSVVTITQNKIISATSLVRVQPSEVLDYITINSIRYTFSPLFPQGLYPGINLAYDNNNFQFNGLTNKANALVTARQIAISGAVKGNVLFDGSENVNLAVTLSNIYVGNTNVTVQGWHTKVYVNDAGQVINGGNILNSDVINALGYTPYNGANISVTNQVNTIVARDSNGNFEANIISGTATYAYALKNPVMIGINGDVVGASSFNGASDITITTTLANIDGLEAGTYNTVRVDQKGRVVAGTITGDTPLGAVVIYDNAAIPYGWAICNGDPATTPNGDIIPTPNLSNVVIGTTFFITKVF